MVLVACANEHTNFTEGGVPGEQCSEPGRTVACYTGPEGTRGIGPCEEGVTTCTWELIWSPCEGEHLPIDDTTCTDLIDEDCDGTVDEGPDADGDGWGACEGDCCDSP